MAILTFSLDLLSFLKDRKLLYRKWLLIRKAQMSQSFQSKERLPNSKSCVKAPTCAWKRKKLIASEMTPTIPREIATLTTTGVQIRSRQSQCQEMATITWCRSSCGVKRRHFLSQFRTRLPKRGSVRCCRSRSSSSIPSQTKSSTFLNLSRKPLSTGWRTQLQLKTQQPAGSTWTFFKFEWATRNR